MDDSKAFTNSKYGQDPRLTPGGFQHASSFLYSLIQQIALSPSCVTAAFQVGDTKLL